MAHKIGSKVWYKGDEVVITSAPYVLFGGEFQDALTESGKTVSIATPEQNNANALRAKSDWKAMQSDFSKLKSA